MKTKAIAGIMLIILVANMLSMAFVIIPTMAYNNPDEFSDAEKPAQPNPTKSPENSWHEISKDDVPFLEESGEENSGTPLSSEDKWNLSETNDWEDFAYIDGNKTRLVVGINNSKPSTCADLTDLTAKNGGEIVSTVSIDGEIIALVVEIPLKAVSSFTTEVQALSLSEYIEPNMKFQAQFVPNDQYWSLQWGPQKIEADWAWNTTTGDPSVLVAVVDTGIDWDHPDLADNYVALGYDWVNNDIDPMDDHGHGTHCAGIIAAVLNNSIGIAGLAQVRVMAEKGLDQWGGGYEDWLANAIIHAVDQGADIISMSWGGYFHSELIYKAIKYAYDADVLLVAAAGNEATSMKLFPAAYDEVIAVVATDRYDGRPYWTNYGDWVELAAPGVDIYSTVWNDGYGYMSGTSMACPHVAGVAALVWSQFPSKARDWVRLWLRYTADDLGAPGFDIYYGYGRVNARKAVERVPPDHELVISSWETPPYVKPGGLAAINATILNFGENDENDIAIKLQANGTIVDSVSISFLASGASTTVSCVWNPLVQGIYNVTLYVVPVPGETIVENNVVWKYIYVGFPVKAVVLDSAGTDIGEVIATWQALSINWHLFGSTMIYIDYTTLNREGITYEDIAATDADVLIISCAYNWQFTDSEIEAINKYVYEGHGLIATAGTFYYYVPNNNKLAPLFGLNETITCYSTGTDLLHIEEPDHPLFAKIPNPLVFPEVGTAVPSDGIWDANELVDGKYIALGHFKESAIVVRRGLVYISPWLEVIPAYYHHHLQLLYNAITWSRYQKPEHELEVSLEAPKHLQPGESALLNATVSNMGLNNETDVELYLLIDGTIVNSTTIPELLVGASHRIDYFWAPSVEKIYNITAYSPPVPDEEFAFNNVDSAILHVRFARFALWDDTKDADGDSLTGNYLSLYQLLTASGFIVDELTVGPITSGLLADYDILVLMDPEVDFWSSEITDIQNWVASGGALISIPDGGYPPTINALMAPYGVQMTGGYGGYGTTTDIVSHPITLDVDAIYVNWVREISVKSPSTCLAWVTEYGERYAFLSATDGGEVVVVSDSNIMDNDGLGMDDNTRLMLNIFNYVGIKLEHELVVTLEAPAFLEPGESTLLNATVRNSGLSNETDVELFLFINGSEVNSTRISTLPTGESYTIDYLWTPTEGTYNVTAYAPPVPSEEYTRNNAASINVRVCYIIARVAVLNSWDIPPYFTGGWSNDYQPLVDALNARDFYAQAVTNEQIIGGILSFFDVFVMVDNVPNSTAVSDVVAFWSNGGGVVAFDSSICFLCYAGILPPESAGSNGYYVYWDYDTGSTAKISTAHPVTAGYEVGQLIHGTSGDAEYRVDALAATSAYPYYITLAEDPYRTDRAYVSAYEPPAEGKVVHIWDQGHWLNTELQLMIINAVKWAPRYKHDIAVTLNAPACLELNCSALLNATVQNKGLNNETDVELYLLINDTVVDSATIPKLLVGESYTIDYLWTPTETGSYNITAYAPPVPGEENLINNIQTRRVKLWFYWRLYLPNEWVGGGVPMGWHADDGSWSYTLPFDFPFYCNYYKTIYISSNGLITFTGPDTSYDNSIPALADKLAIAPAWDDWETYSPYDIYIWQNSTHVGIRWEVAAHYNLSIIANFEAILSSDGVIQFNYGYNNGNISATIGISNGKAHVLAEDKSNLNYISTIVFAPFPLKNDVAIVSVVPSSHEVLVGDTVYIAVVAENQGNATQSFTVTAYASSLNSTKIYLDPSNYIFDTGSVSVGYRFNVTVMAEDVADLAGWQVCMYYNDSIIDVTRWFEPTWDPNCVFYGKATSPLPPPPEVSYWHVGPGTGSATVASCLFPPPPDQTPFNGKGKLCIIEFEIKAVPSPGEVLSCNLIIDNVDTYLLNSDGEEILDVRKENGYYELIWRPPPPPPGIYRIGTTTVTNLAPGARITLTFAWNTTGMIPKDYRIWAEASVVLGETDTGDNTYIDDIIRIKKFPIASFAHSPLFPKPAETIVFNASTSTPNGGTIISYYWDFGDGNTTTTTDPVITHIYAFSGLFNATLTITDSEGFTDSTWQMIYVFIRDVAVIDVTPSTNQTYVGRTVTINVTIINEGEVTETFDVILYYNITAGDIVGTQKVSNLPPGESITLTFRWNTTGVNPRKYNITGVATPLLGETDLLDNTLSTSVHVKMLGDVNGDGKVDLKDYYALARSFGETPDRPGWNPMADINGDEKVDLKDVYICAKNYGRVQDPCP